MIYNYPMSRFTPSKRSEKIIKNTKGFTLVELLIVVLILGLLGTMAISNYIGTAGTFGFIAKQKEIASLIRKARTLAVTDKDMGYVCGNGGNAVAVTAQRYGVKIEAHEITLFADVSPFNDFRLGVCEEMSDMKMKILTLSNDYELSVMPGADLDELELPVTLLYERGSADFSVREDGNGANSLVSKEAYKYVSVKLENTDNNQESFILIFQVSGLPESLNNLDEVN